MIYIAVESHGDKKEVYETAKEAMKHLEPDLVSLNEDGWWSLNYFGVGCAKTEEEIFDVAVRALNNDPSIRRGGRWIEVYESREVYEAELEKDEDE